MRPFIIRVLTLFFLFWLTGCMGVSPRPAFYLLEDSVSPAADIPAAVPANLSVGIGTVSIPSHLDRPEIVTQGEGNGIKINEFHRWGAPLVRQFRQNLMTDLSSLLKTPWVVLYPWEHDRRPRFRVDVTVLRFAKGTSDAVFEAIWYIKDVKNDRAVMTLKFSMASPVAGTDMAAYVAAQGRAAAAMNREIALGIINAANE